MVRGYGRYYRKEREGGNNINNSTLKLSKNQQMGECENFYIIYSLIILSYMWRNWTLGAFMKIKNDPRIEMTL